jgi:hypothetical protein
MRRSWRRWHLGAGRRLVVGHPRMAGVGSGPPRFGMLLIAAVLSFVIQGAVRPGPVQEVVVTALAGCCLLLALRAARVPPWALGIAVAAAASAVTVSIARAAIGGGDGAARAMNAALLLLGPPAVAVGVIDDLRRTGGVRVQAVMGVLSLYLLVGLLYAFVYGAVDRLGGGPVFGGDTPATVAQCVYFSFSTLATVGYGDIVARTDFGHTLAISEALLGQIYLVTVVSLLVSNLGASAREVRR